MNGKINIWRIEPAAVEMESLHSVNEHVHLQEMRPQGETKLFMVS